MIDGRLILVAGALLAAGISAALLARRLRVPGLVLFLCLGTALGSGGLSLIHFGDFEAARSIGTVGLALILFEGGLAAGFTQVRAVLWPSAALATIGTIVTAVLMGLFASWVVGLSLLNGLLFGGIVASTDSAAIFSVLRGSSLRRRLARTLEAESGFNDPLAVLLVIGCINLIQIPGYDAADVVALFARQIAVGLAIGLACGVLGGASLRRMPFPTTGLYPVASIAIAAVSFGAADTLGGSGFLSVYLSGLVLGGSHIPARRTIADFHDGLAWVSQIALFFTLGLLVSVSQLGAVATTGLVLAAVLALFARPIAVFVSTLGFRFSAAENALLGWAGLRGAVPIVLAILPIIKGVGGSQSFLPLVFFVVLSSALVQGATFEPLASALGVTSSEGALAQPLIEIGAIRRLGAEVVEYLVGSDDAIVGVSVAELGLPHEALLSVIVRNEQALLPRGSTPIEAGDRLHVLVREHARDEVENLGERWHAGPIAARAPGRPQLRGHTPILTVRPWRDPDGDPARPDQVGGVEVVRFLRTRPDRPGALMQLADGRYAVTTDGICAVGGPRELFRYTSMRLRRTRNPAQLAWWQEVGGALPPPLPR